MSSGILKVHGERIVDTHGDDVVLRGAALGGYYDPCLEDLSIGIDHQ